MGQSGKTLNMVIKGTAINKYQISKEIEEKAKERFDSYYGTYFKDLKSIFRVLATYLQMKGHDVYLYFKNGERLIIDEKTRLKDREDVLIEYLSNRETGRLGWGYTNESNYLAYLFPTKGCYFLDTQLIRKWVCDKTSSFWNYEDAEATNERNGSIYHTDSKIIPICDLEAFGIVKWHLKL